MNNVNPQTQPRIEQSVFLSEILGTQVTLRGKRIGKLSDLVIHENGTLPLVTHLYISRPFGESSLIPWGCVSNFSTRAIEIEVDSLEAYPKEPEETAVLLKDNILDKRALDLDGREVEVVYDVKLVLRANKLYVSDVDLSRYGLLRRMHLKGLADFIYKLADSIREQTISWTYIEPLPQRMGRFTGDVQLKVVKEALVDMHPVDIADILEEVDHEQRLQLFNELDVEQASDTLEEISPSVQRDLVSGLSKEKVAELLNDMTPGQAADVLSALPANEAEDITGLLSPETGRKVTAIIEHQEENILDYTTQEFLTFSPDETAGQVLDEYRFAARGKDSVMYLFVVDADRRLLGVADIKEVLQADEGIALRDIMTENPISLDADSTLKEAFRMFTRYNFRALPVIDSTDRILGVVPYRDIVGLQHHFVEL